ncbi:hypothetical protein [Actinoplanes sp. URMC 104]|uniref:hypothetical protein n=1 Tax=Actinoplanes sp. URMC 104 TaxID=3423409 RepID=UPI003F1AF1D4
MPNKTKRALAALATVAAVLAIAAQPAQADEPGLSLSDLTPGVGYLVHNGEITELNDDLPSAGETATAQRARATASAQGGDVTAAAVQGCPTSADSGGYGYLCLYDYVNWNGGRWQTNTDVFWPASVTSTRSSCWNLSNSTFSTGGNVNNSAASIVVTASSWAPENAPNDGNYPHTWYWVLFDWVNCQSAGDFIFYPIEYNGGDSQLQWSGGGSNVSFWENPTSIQMVSDNLLNQMISNHG